LYSSFFLQAIRSKRVKDMQVNNGLGMGVSAKFLFDISNIVSVYSFDSLNK
tara:strand:+ start:957 stop:1109 length:153 start_codon:yes stop_codon:yes gene_type:complete